MNFFYIVPDGLKISGLLTWGLNFRTVSEKCKLLFLNQDSPLPNYFKPERDFRRMESHLSHDVKKVTDELEHFVKSFPSEPAIIIPSCGDTAFGAAHQLMQRWLKRKDSQPLRIIGSIFGDQENPYNVIAHHQSSLSAICGNSSEIISKLEARLPARKKDIFQWKPFIPPILISSQWDEGSPLKLLFAGRLEEQAKKVSRLPKICKELIRLKVPFQLNIAGEGPEKDSLTKALSEFDGIKSAQIRFLGLLGAEGLAKAFSENHVFLLTSKTEGLPMALLEAMSAALCPVVMDIPSGISEIITHKENGILARQGDCKAFAQGIRELYCDKSLLEKLRKASRKFVLENYGPEEHSRLISSEASKCLLAEPPIPHEIEPFHNECINGVANALDSNSRNIGVFGAGMYGRKLIDALIEKGIVPTAIYDSLLPSTMESYREIPISTPSEMPGSDLEYLVFGTAEFVQEMEDIAHSAYQKAKIPLPTIIRQNR